MSDRYATIDGRKNNDLAVIRATSAGFSAAITGAEQVAQVALIGSGAISNFEPPGAQEDGRPCSRRRGWQTLPR
jgi:hypothetical protein